MRELRRDENATLTTAYAEGLWARARGQADQLGQQFEDEVREARLDRARFLVFEQQHEARLHELLGLAQTLRSQAVRVGGADAYADQPAPTATGSVGAGPAGPPPKQRVSPESSTAGATGGAPEPAGAVAGEGWVGDGSIPEPLRAEIAAVRLAHNAARGYRLDREAHIESRRASYADQASAIWNETRDVASAYWSALAEAYWNYGGAISTARKREPELPSWTGREY